MSSDRQYGKVIFICNKCEEHIETNERDFDKALAHIKREGWTPVRWPDGAWRHYCGDCKGA